MASKPATKKTVPRRRARRSNAQLFIAKLTDLSAAGQKLVANKTLRDSLDWDELKYNRIRSELLSQQKVIVGRGQGGTIGLAAAPGTKAFTVFISYSHVDETLKTELIKHLQPLQRLQLIESWHDRKLKAGEEWERTISAKLDSADVILLLVSIDFINSVYCYDIEMERAMERHSANEAVVIPVILRSCMWQQTPFANIQALPKDARAIALWADRDEALVNVAEGIRQLLEQRLSEA